MTQTFKDQIKAKHDLVSIVHDIEIIGFFRKKAIILGANPFYNYIEIVHDYNTGQILREEYTNIRPIPHRPAFA